MTFPSLRLLLVGPLPPPAGGMANQTRQLAELLRGEGVQVEVAQVNAPYRPAWAGRIKGLRALFRLVPYLLALWRGCGRADLVHVMANSGWSWHLFAAPAVWIAWLRGTPVVVNYRGGEADAFLTRAGKWVQPTMRRAAALVLPSSFLLEVFARHGMPGRVVPNIIDLDRFRPAAAPGAASEAPRLVVARNLEPIYGNDVALQAFARILEHFPTARLTVAGSGPEAASLAELARNLGIAERVHFTGRLDRDQMAALYRDAHLMLNASRVDNMPNAVLEALASGVPVVSSNVGGIPHMVRDRHTAMLIPPDNAPALADAALDVLRDAGLRAQLVANGLAEVRQYRWDSVRTVLATTYDDAMRAARPQLT
ncbi:glycosyltransferase family 4 protein [Thauera sp. 2A1]|uniref:glycosyltransferase family 4 protein n=1 Tax=Thauera sp. 2A1 TaxID=2570191 RepID=UPI001291D8FE|nr:glycosyltransferase family 4 protein [Thauera sp. 2A1]KAI5916658.1 glycosyltransferase family 4 protein [Thauera sp. 2A1]